MPIDSVAELSILPSPSTPPEAIYESSTNQDVQLYVYRLLRENESSLNTQNAWDKARKVLGNGRAVLRFKEEDWTEQLGIHGCIIHREIEAQKYVNVSNKFKSYLMILICLYYRQIQSGHGFNSFRYYFWSWLHLLPDTISPKRMDSKTPVVSPLPSSPTQVSYASSIHSHPLDGLKIAAPSQPSSNAGQQDQDKALGCLHLGPVRVEREGAHGSRNRRQFHQDID